GSLISLRQCAVPSPVKASQWYFETNHMSRGPGHPITPCPTSSLTSDSLDQTLVEAINRHHAGDASGAEQLYRAILNSSPGHALASYGLGLLCATQGRLPEAIDNY